jgi:hypothetical protein
MRIPEVRRIDGEPIFLTRTPLKDIPEKPGYVPYKGFLVPSSHIRELNGQEVAMLKIPVIAKSKRGWRNAFFATSNEPAILQTPVILVTNVADNEVAPNFKCGSYAKYGSALTELQVSHEDKEFLRVASKYDFPAEFIREGFTYLTDLSALESQATWKSIILTDFREHSRLPQNVLNREIVVDLDNIGLTTVLLFDKKKWDSIFGYWNHHSKRLWRAQLNTEKQRVISMLALPCVALAFGVGAYFALVYAGFDIKSMLITLGFGLLLSLASRLVRTIRAKVPSESIE